jgi:hypothetical protein
MNEIKLEKLDNRHTLVTFFTHRARLRGIDDAPKFIEIRNWLWEQYGPGIERELVWVMKYQNTLGNITEVPTKWAWHVDDNKYYIYLKEETLTHFTLKWMNA